MFFSALGIILTFQSALAVNYTQPEQVHLAYGENINDIVVTWSTFSETKSIVEYGRLFPGLQTKVYGISTLFVDGGSLKRSQYIHKVVLKDLDYNATYMYQCGSELGWSELFFFRTPPPEDKWKPYFAIYGDLGYKNGRIIPQLQKEVHNGIMYDAILHNGDFAYNFETDNGSVGDEFMRQIQPIAAYLPYMTSPGNHESAYNFSHYRNRFNMPGLPDSMFYSMNLGPIHFISFSSEDYYYLDYVSPIVQYRWLENDLEIANRPESRAKQPWIVTMAHRPMYCTTIDRFDCDQAQTLIRNGIPNVCPGLEDLFNKYEVDLTFWAHEHNYERLWPLYNFTVYNGSLEEPYTNPGAPVHITSGAAGSQENISPFHKEKKDWSAFRNLDYSYTRMKVHNGTHIYMEQVSVDDGGSIVDSIWLIKDSKNNFKRRAVKLPACSYPKVFTN